MHNINYNLYKYFFAVMQEFSVSKAAKSLGVSQPTVSSNIAELERLLGYKLFENNGREMVALDKAWTFYMEIKPLLSGLKSIETNIFNKKTASKVKVRIGIKAGILTNELLAFLNSKINHIEIVSGDMARLVSLLFKTKDDSIDMIICAVTERGLEIRSKNNKMRNYEVLMRLNYSLCYKKECDVKKLPFMCHRTTLNEEIYKILGEDKTGLYHETSPETIMEFVRLGTVKTIMIDDFIDAYNRDNTLIKEKLNIDNVNNPAKQHFPDYFLTCLCNTGRISASAMQFRKELIEYYKNLHT